MPNVLQAVWIPSTVSGSIFGDLEFRKQKLSALDIVLRSINDLDVFGFLTRPTLSIIDSYGGFDNHIIYAVLHEAIYCQGYGLCSACFGLL
jgi:hypothetical protein